jgi:hypothetical protein
VTKVETVLAQLATDLESLFGSDKFFRDPEKPPQESECGTIIMRNGDPGQPTVTLSPVHYQWEHEVPLEFAAVGENRNSTVDAMLLQLDVFLTGNRNLDGNVIDARVMIAPIIDEVDQAEGAQTIRVAQVMVRLEYDSASPIG